MVKHSEPWDTRSIISRWAHVLERTGLALTGASCALFVALHVGRANIGLIDSAVTVLAMILYGRRAFISGSICLALLPITTCTCCCATG